MCSCAWRLERGSPNPDIMLIFVVLVGLGTTPLRSWLLLDSMWPPILKSQLPIITTAGNEPTTSSLHITPAFSTHVQRVKKIRTTNPPSCMCHLLTSRLDF